MKAKKTLLLVLVGVCALGLLLVRAWAWETTIAGTCNNCPESARAVAVDGAGDVVAAGAIQNNFTGSDFIVMKLSGATGGELWRQVINGPGDFSSDFAQAVTVDGVGDVVAAGVIDDRTSTTQDFAVVKLSGTTGVELWRLVIPGTSFDAATAVAVDAAGHVVAGGYITGVTGGTDLIVVKIDGLTGAEIWRQVINGSANGSDQAQAVKVNEAGDVVAAGAIDNTGTSRDFSVVKFSGATGAELWRRTINGAANDIDQANDLALDAAGDVVAFGVITDAGLVQRLTAVKFSGVTGVQIWRQAVGQTFAPSFARAVSVDAIGDLVVGAGATLDTPGSVEFTVIKLSGATGVELWRRVVVGTESGGQAASVAMDNLGDVVAAGSTRNTNPGSDFSDFAVVKLAGNTGAELWRREIDGSFPFSENDSAASVTVDTAGDVVAAGGIAESGTNADFAVVKLIGTNGRDFPCGNGIVDPGEQCDDANLVSCDGCSPTCQTDFCGDGQLSTICGEECDDGNLVSGDGCEPDCTVSPGIGTTATRATFTTARSPSTTPATLLSLNVSLPTTRDLLVSFSVECDTTQNGGIDFGLQVDGGTLSPPSSPSLGGAFGWWAQEATGLGLETQQWTTVVPSVAVGIHTVSVQWQWIFGFQPTCYAGELVVVPLAAGSTTRATFTTARSASTTAAPLLSLNVSLPKARDLLVSFSGECQSANGGIADFGIELDGTLLSPPRSFSFNTAFGWWDRDGSSGTEAHHWTTVIPAVAQGGHSVAVQWQFAPPASGNIPTCFAGELLAVPLPVGLAPRATFNTAQLPSTSATTLLSTSLVLGRQSDLLISFTAECFSNNLGSADFGVQLDGSTLSPPRSASLSSTFGWVRRDGFFEWGTQHWTTVAPAVPAGTHDVSVLWRWSDTSLFPDQPTCGAGEIVVIPLAGVPVALCGNGNVEEGEQCDDGLGNGTPGSCCTEACQFASAGTVCRAAAGGCDLAENCTGTSAACPADGFASDGTVCDDGDLCTITDQCVSGVCTGTAIVCNDGNACTTDTCDPATGCANTPVNSACDDGNVCTTDTCDTVLGCLNNGTGITIACNDGNACTTGDVCQGDAAGTCAGIDTSAVDCDDANACTDDTCDPVLRCQHTDTLAGTSCGDTTDTACDREDTCDGFGTCQTNIEPNGTPCPDGLVCNGDETCQSGVCTAGTPIPGCCKVDAECDNGDVCDGIETCVNNTCVTGTPLNCNDGNACTTDTCAPATGCVNTPINVPVVCNDGNACTDDACDSASGCLNTPVVDGILCDDVDPCTVDDVCTSGVCGGSVGSPPQEDVIPDKNRYLSFTAGDVGQIQAVRVTFQALPGPHAVLDGTRMWVQAPIDVCENSGQESPPCEGATFKAAKLGCTPQFMDWSAVGTVHVSHRGIVPSGVYHIQVLNELCALDREEGFSPPLVLTQASWGDVAGPFDTSAGEWTAPDGGVDVTVDILAVLDKFRNLPTGPIKARVDLEPSEPDRKINITDVTRNIDAFRGFDYPFPPSPAPCG